MIPSIVVAASGGGTNFQALIDAAAREELSVRFSGLIAGSENAGAIKRAEKNGIPIFILPRQNDAAAEAQRMLDILEACKPDLIVLAGWLRKIPASVLKRYPDQIINIHPSLLPKFGGKGFYGLKVHEAVLEAGETESGCTVHMVNEAYDEGHVLGQRRIPVLPDDSPQSLASRVLEQEHQLYPACIRQLLQERVSKPNAIL
ncbi:phosphoribosylglycinamide formyltransferase-1 [Cyclonatronum proteinivorum]|uniref:Phosphoribosylglycinamide formyltransferase n=1 Tax=Cyclonatronum proteinivorum TaxID=1457365 RepID=A0A345UMZ8_9BACT|nr:phosphoribosylglycinamide formyltransferase [Cyclonatronum proteinivorum]AXJ01850.1 phosphoribosylglycinamide formyltransferase-1 [Cyclonatronum proteinivorum]